MQIEKHLLRKNSCIFCGNDPPHLLRISKNYGNFYVIFVCHKCKADTGFELITDEKEMKHIEETITQMNQEILKAILENEKKKCVRCGKTFLKEDMAFDGEIWRCGYCYDRDWFRSHENTGC